MSTVWPAGIWNRARSNRAGGRVTSIEIAKRRVHEPVFAAAMGESLPFADRSFDLVTMNQVLEHVSDQPAVLREAARVVKGGCAIYVACPNYLRFYEPHYKIYWLPLLPKALGRWYLRLRGRNPVLLEQLTYTINSRLQTLGELGPEFSVVDLHRDQFLKKCANGSFASRRAQIVCGMKRLPLLGHFIRRAALLFLRVTEGGCEMLVLRQPTAASWPC